jgi:hypothetical protein
MATIKAFQSLKVAGKQHTSVGSHALQTYKEAATQEFNAGAPLCNSAGRVAEITDPVGDTESIVGIAMADASGTTDTDVVVAPALPGMVFEGVLGNVADDDYEIAAADVFKLAALRRDDTNDTWFLGANDAHATNPVAGAGCRIVGLKDPVGTVNGRVFFVFLDTRQNAADNGVVAGTIYS